MLEEAKKRGMASAWSVAGRLKRRHSVEGRRFEAETVMVLVRAMWSEGSGSETRCATVGRKGSGS